MNKKTAGERKRTVTVTVGPNTVALMEELNMVLWSQSGTQQQSLTDLAGACLNQSLTVWRKALLKVEFPTPVSHWD
jgi:hypothetical protein